MYYLVYIPLYLLSLLPLRVLYLFSDLAATVVFRWVGYRSDIVRSNLKIAFPEKSDEERRKIALQFYRNFTDTFIETIKLLSSGDKWVDKRGSFDPALLEELIKKGKNIHVMAGHQFNWEFGNFSVARKLSVPWVGIYMRISNKALDRLFYNIRRRYGTVLIPAQEFSSRAHSIFSKQYTLGLAADQNPGNPSNAFWMKFFDRPVPFVKGPSKGAVKNETAVVFVAMVKIKRGHYSFVPSLIAENGADHTPEDLTIKYRDILEQTIRKDPSNYLWTHRRWKWEYKSEYGPMIS